MQPIPLNFLTLYADLAQNVQKSGFDRGSVVERQRRGTCKAKKPKDLAQARELLAAHVLTDRASAVEAIADGRSRGRKWRRNIDTSLAEISLDADLEPM